MRFIGKLVLGLVVLVGVLALTAFALPRQVEVSRSTVVNAPANKLFPLVNDLKRHTEWSPWAKIDPDAKYVYQGPAQGVGQKVSWSSEHPHVGTGSQTIVESVDNSKIATALDFGDHGTALARFDFAPEGAATRVTWGFETDTGNNPIARWMGLMMDKWIGEAYDEGLANLKKLAESAP